MAHQSRGIVSYVHIWWGRLLMALGVINGGLGLSLAGASTALMAAYAAVAAIVFVCYVAAKGVGFLRARRRGGKAHGIKLAEVSDRSSPRGGPPPGGPAAGYRPGGNVAYGQQHYSNEQRRQRQYEQHEAEQASRRAAPRGPYEEERARRERNRYG